MALPLLSTTMKGALIYHFLEEECGALLLVVKIVQDSFIRDL